MKNELKPSKVLVKYFCLELRKIDSTQGPECLWFKFSIQIAFVTVSITKKNFFSILMCREECQREEEGLKFQIFLDTINR